MAAVLARFHRLALPRVLHHDLGDGEVQEERDLVPEEVEKDREEEGVDDHAQVVAGE
jgi:hypothetical protein